MAQQKLYTEEQVRSAIKSALDGFGIGQTEDTIDVVVSKLIPIELPSDEEIYLQIEKTIEGEFIGYPSSFRKGAKWMRDKILNK